MTSPELQELREEYKHYCKYLGGRDMCINAHIANGPACTILTTGACPRPTAPDKWYHDKEVAGVIREEHDAMQAWVACDCTEFGCEHHMRWQRANGAFVYIMRSDSERRAQGGTNDE